MDGYSALAVAVPRRLPGPPAEEIARARSLPALAKRVRALAPAAPLTLFDPAPGLLCEGLPVRGVAREPGRLIFLCGPASAAVAWDLR
jgi:hypothetical protein